MLLQRVSTAAQSSGLRAEYSEMPISELMSVRQSPEVLSQQISV